MRRWDWVPTILHCDWWFLAWCSANRVCVPLRSQVINHHYTHLPKGPPHDIIDAWLFRSPLAPFVTQVRAYDWSSQRWRWTSIDCHDQCTMSQKMNHSCSLVSRCQVETWNAVVGLCIHFKWQKTGIKSQLWSVYMKHVFKNHQKILYDWSSFDFCSFWSVFLTPLTTYRKVQQRLALQNYWISEVVIIKESCSVLLTRPPDTSGVYQFKHLIYKI